MKNPTIKIQTEMPTSGQFVAVHTYQKYSKTGLFAYTYRYLNGVLECYDHEANEWQHDSCSDLSWMENDNIRDVYFIVKP